MGINDTSRLGAGPLGRRTVLALAATAFGMALGSAAAQAQTLTVWSGYPEMVPFYQRVGESLKGKYPVRTSLMLITLVGVAIAFMPDTWTDRMNTISEYEQDGSAMGRISAWWNAWGIAKNYVFGVGFNAARPE